MELFKIIGIQAKLVKAKSNDKEISIAFPDIFIDELGKQKYDKDKIKTGDYLRVQFLSDTDIDFGVYIPKEHVEQNQISPTQDPNYQRRSKTEPPISSMPSPQLGPIGMHRQQLKDLLLPENTLKALETQFSSYRHSRLDSNSFYRAAGIGILEYISSPITTIQFKQNFYNSLLDARKNLADYWGEDNESWLQFVGSYLDTENNFDTAQRLQWLENEVYADAAYAYQSGLITMAKLLEAVWINNNNSSENYLNYATRPYEEAIYDIMAGSSQPGEDDIYFFSLSIGAELNIIQVLDEHKINKKSYNEEGKKDLINLLELNETLYPLFSHEQVYYESNVIEKARLEPIRALNGEKWPIEKIRENETVSQSKNSEALKSVITLLIKEKEIGSYHWSTLDTLQKMISGLGIFNSSDTEMLENVIAEKQCKYCCKLADLITLNCGCQICKEDLKATIQKSTGGYMVLSNWEKENQKELLAKCPICEKILEENDETMILVIGDPGEFQRLKQASLDRELIQNPPKVQCKCCLEEKLEKMFFKTEEVNCTHVCWECMLENIRRNNLECPECQIKYTDSFLSNVKSWQMPCSNCKDRKSLLKDFSRGEICKKHKMICLECLTLFEEFKYCLPCGGEQFNEAELEKLKEMLHKECKQCGKPYSRLESLEKKDCFCNICENCQCESIDYCIICHKEFTDGIKNILRMRKSEKGDEERRKQLAMRQCGICTEMCSITTMIGLNCNHYFCENHLKDMLKYYIESRQLDNATRCPHDNCQAEISSIILENLLTRELWDKLNQFLIDQRMNIITCPGCGIKFEAPASRKVICFSCRCEFCKKCSEIWHEEENCEEINAQRRMKEMEDAGEVMSQCPGCKQPYTKDDHCEHVVCLNPKCKTVFCFTCACLRSPTMAHANHYHRPDCKWFAPLPAADKDRYLPEKCDECKRLGELCKPPMKLAVPRRFAPGEV